MLELPLFEGLKGAEMAECPLGHVMIIDGDLAPQGLL
jgi:hypothetical protein